MNFIRQIPNFLTSLNLAVGVLGIINVFRGDFTNTIFFILLAGFFDFWQRLKLDEKKGIGHEAPCYPEKNSIDLLKTAFIEYANKHLSEVGEASAGTVVIRAWHTAFPCKHG